MCFFNSELGRYYSFHTVLIFLLLAGLASWWQYQPLDLALSAQYFEASSQQFIYARQPLVYFFGKYAIWLIPFGGAFVWATYGMVKAPLALRSMYVRIALFFFGSPLVIGVIKQFTAMPRPMYLEQFGGDQALPISFWAQGWAQGGGALPSVHATCGFIFIAVYYLGWVQAKAHLRWLGLGLALVLGFGFGYLRIMQGYHSLSQVLWSQACIWLFASVWFVPELKKAGQLRPACV
ncbi:phosphatase PAP2 family protein [Paenalcaligenes hominis]|uniref:phosphatase PAP2 family protein n=1 Tax=Paenalcaligenes hominis TaxID=643674 RepID=UPI003524B1E8